MKGLHKPSDQELKELNLILKNKKISLTKDLINWILKPIQNLSRKMLSWLFLISVKIRWKSAGGKPSINLNKNPQPWQLENY